MSVLACDRLDCENIMCNRLSEQHGYLCRGCFNELVQLGTQTDVALFMATPPTRNMGEAIEAFFAAQFPLRESVQERLGEFDERY